MERNVGFATGNQSFNERRPALQGNTLLRPKCGPVVETGHASPVSGDVVRRQAIGEDADINPTAGVSGFLRPNLGQGTFTGGINPVASGTK